MSFGGWLALGAGAIVALIAAAGFLLWGRQGPAILFDAFIAFCA
ncbi:MAG: hypothetical protein RIM84_02885 [Alphaproteobacteria bacterium]